MKKLILLFLLSGFILGSCKKDNEGIGNNSTAALTKYTLPSYPGFPAPYLIAANPLSKEGIKLGRMIFYDYSLSGNGRACASCHQQATAFTVDNALLGLDPKIYHNIPSLVNKAWQPDFLYYGSVPQLDLVCEADFEGPDAQFFLDPNMDTVIKKFKNNPTYEALFKQVFQKDVLNKNDVVKSISYAVSQFVRTISSYGSKYDLYKEGKATLSPAEWRGMATFFTEKGDCFHCHGTALMTDNQYHNIGLDSDFSTADKGRYKATGDQNDMGKFRSPTLRNIALTAPYMHDGRFKTLDEVIEHYNSGMKHSETLDPLMTLPYKATGLHLTPQDKSDLKAFLLTFTDSSLVTNPALGSPF